MLAQIGGDGDCGGKSWGVMSVGKGGGRVAVPEEEQSPGVWAGFPVGGGEIFRG